MKQLFMIAGSICILLLGSSFAQTATTTYAEEGSKKEETEEHHHHFISEKDFKRLSEEGYSKGDIYKAAHIAKFSDNKIDDVLKTYKENNSSWEKTAKHYGFDMEKLKKKCRDEKEKFLEEHKEEVIENVAVYSGKSEEEIEKWVAEGISLRFIVGAAALAKAGNKDLAELVQHKKEGQSYKDIKKNLNIDHKVMHKEMITLMKMIKDDIID